MRSSLRVKNREGGERSCLMSRRQRSPVKPLQPLKVFATVLCAVFIVKVSLKFVSGAQDSLPGGFEGQARKKVISYSLYGSESRYMDGAIANARLVKSIYDDWSMRIYHDSSVPAGVLRSLEDLDVELINMSGTVLNGMTWRFLVASDRTVDVWCSRDIDSRLSFREKVCVDEWLGTKQSVHIIRDHPSHTQVIPGGTWCGTRNAIPEMESILKRTSVPMQYGADQNFLKRHVWPRLKANTIQHVSFGCARFKGSRPIPVKRKGLEHVGSVFIDGKPRSTDLDILQAALLRGIECT